MCTRADNMTEAVSSAQIYLAVEMDGVWHKFHEVKSSPEVGETAEKIDATHFDSDIKEYIKDIPDQASDLEFTMNAMPTGVQDSNYDLIKSMSRNATYNFKYGIPQMGIYFIIKGQWTWRMGAGEVSSVQDIILTIIPKARPNDTAITGTFTVTYSANGGSGTVTDADSPYSNGAEVKVMASTGLTAPEGKVFLSWNTRADGMGATYDEGDTFNIYANTTMYAIWATATQNAVVDENVLNDESVTEGLS